MGLMPIMWSTGTGADVMKRVAAPMVGGLASSFLLELLVYPALSLLWKQRPLPSGELGGPARSRAVRSDLRAVVARSSSSVA